MKSISTNELIPTYLPPLREESLNQYKKLGVQLESPSPSHKKSHHEGYMTSNSNVTLLRRSSLDNPTRISAL